jgi:hypothetical protein
MAKKKGNPAGGLARAESLTPEQRSEIAKKAAAARWSGTIPVTEYEGVVRIGDTEIAAAVLPDGRRVLTQSTFLLALGRSRTPKAGTGVLSTVDELPFFLQATALQPFIDNDLRTSTMPVFFRTREGKKAVGYNAELLPKTCEVYLKLRDASLEKSGKVDARYQHLVAACDVLMRGLAQVGIIALVDEATGYQAVRDRNVLQAILDKYLAKELAAWAKRFPDEFYWEMFRLKGWPFNPMSVKRPQVVGKYTTDVVYERLAPGIVEELERINPKNTRGNRGARHHQWLSDDIGHPALAQHLHAVMGLMRVSGSWEQFVGLMDRAFPRKGHTIPMLLE